MTKFNTKKESSKKPTLINHMWEKAYSVESELELALTVLTSFIDNSYYESKNETIQRLQELVQKCDPYFVAQLAVYTRDKANMRSSSHVLAGILAKYLSWTTFWKDFYEKIVIRPDDMSEIVWFYLSQNWKDASFPNSMKKGFKSALEKLSNYQIAKYKMEWRDIKLVDLINLFHPKSKANNLHKLMKWESVVADTWEVKLSEAGQIAENDEELLFLKADWWESQLNSEYWMPMMALVRNLKNIILQAPHMVDEVVKQLTNKEKVLNSRLLPFRFIQAYTVISELTIDKNSIDFSWDKKTIDLKNLKTKILDALEESMNISIDNLPDLQWKVAILSDNSWSMGWEYASSLKENSFISSYSKVSTANIANLFATMMYMKSSNNYVGLFWDKLKSPTNLNKENWIWKNYIEMTRLAQSCGGSTEEWIYQFFRDIVKNETKMDMIIVFSDCQIWNWNQWYWTSRKHWYDSTGDFDKLFKEFRKINPDTKVISVDLKHYWSTVFNDWVLKIWGWSNEIFNLVDKLKTDKDALLKEIKSIQI